MMVKGKSLTKKEKEEYDSLKTIKLIENKDICRFNFLQNKFWNSYEHLDEKKFLKKYGKKELEMYWFHEQLCGTITASWECRDCIILNDEEYFNKISEVV